jgi:hypothetical protein
MRLGESERLEEESHKNVNDTCALVGIAVVVVVEKFRDLQNSLSK